MVKETGNCVKERPLIEYWNVWDGRLSSGYSFRGLPFKLGNKYCVGSWTMTELRQVHVPFTHTKGKIVTRRTLPNHLHTQWHIVWGRSTCGYFRDLLFAQVGLFCAFHWWASVKDCGGFFLFVFEIGFHCTSQVALNLLCAYFFVPIP
jgi:hypothetical protein